MQTWLLNGSHNGMNVTIKDILSSLMYIYVTKNKKNSYLFKQNIALNLSFHYMSVAFRQADMDVTDL